MNLRRRIERLERDRTADLPTFVIVEPGDLAADLVVTWGEIDAGTFSGSEYHARGMLTLRDALRKMGAST